MRTIVVAGAAKAGIGYAIAEAVLKSGDRLIGTYQPGDDERALTLQRVYGDQITLTKVDHTVRDEMSSFVQSLPAEVDALVVSQFVFEMEDPENYDHALWDWLVAMNLTAPNYLVREIEPKIAPGGAVVIITSTEGFIGSFGGAAYSACKAGMHNLVKTFANNFGSRNIRTNAVAGGWIGGVEDTDEIFNVSRNLTPLSRLGDASEVASTVLFLLGEGAGFVNGTTITVDGGYTGVDTLAKYEYDEFKRSQEQ